ncbi:MAG: hypothetical protein QNJ62_12605 [Methyloceanibacter sp.]|nr:hypothetical protein [Methyloceanibacter sp.]
MHRRLQRQFRPIAGVAAAALILSALAGCGTTSSLGSGGSNSGPAAGTDTNVGGLWSGGSKPNGFPGFTRKAGPNDRPTRVGWLSARASHCGFVFDPAQLRAQYFAFEQSYGADSKRMQEVQKAYDYSLEATADRAKENANYCTKERVDEIRPELNRYLAGDFRLL